MKSAVQGLAIAAMGLLAVAGCRSGEVSPGGASPLGSTSPLPAGASVVLIANLAEAEDNCGCGEIIRDVRAAARKGVSTKEVDTRTSKDEAKKHRVVIVPAVLFLDASGKELRRYEGESEETIKNMKADLERLSTAKK